MKAIQAECAAKIVEGVPFVMRYLREQFRAQREFTVPQIRVLGYLHYRACGTLSELAAHQGVSMPTMSKLVTGLVQRKLIKREEHGEDKRKLKLQLTPEGARAYDAAREGARRYVAEKLSHCTADEQSKLSEALDLLQAVFSKK